MTAVHPPAPVFPKIRSESGAPRERKLLLGLWYTGATFRMELYRDRAFLTSVASGLVLLLMSLAAVFYSTNYANLSASNSVTDIVLSNTRVYDVDAVFIYGALLVVGFISALVVVRPRYLPFTMKAIALLYFIRSIAVSLTHISSYPYRAVLDQSSFFLTSHFFRVFFTGDDLFFSGHVALPLLMGLIFWENLTLRLMFFSASGIFAVVVLLGHLHYTIDVFTAFFITYSIYVIARRLFHKDFLRIAPEAAPVV